MRAVKLSPSSLHELLQSNKVYLVDVREPTEYDREHIDGANLYPLSSLDANHIWKEADSVRAVCVMCATGGRSAKAADLLQKAAEKSNGKCAGITLYDLSGGMSAWRSSKLPVIENTNAPLPIIRQVHIIASSLILLGIAMSHLYSRKFLALPLAVGCGLMVSGVTGFCGMATLLQFLPYNRRA